MPEWYKKRILQRPGHETQSVTERPSEFYQLELPDFKIPTVTNSEDSIMTGLENRKERDIWEHKGRASGINNTDASLQQEHPSLFLLPFAPEIMGSGLGLGVLKTLGGYAGGYINGRLGKLAGSAIDKTFNTQLFEPTLELAGDFIGFGKGYNALNKIGINRAFRWASKTGKSVPNWFMRPELRTTIEPINQRTIFAENQTPKYNSSQIGNGNRRVYQSPTTFMGIYPKKAVASDFSGVENIEPGNFGYGGQKPNFGLRKLRTEQRSRQLLDSVAEEEKRNASALKWTGKNWKDLSYTDQYWLGVNHGNEWNNSSIVPRTSQTRLLSLNEDFPRESIPMWKRIGHIIRKAQDDLNAMSQYHIQNVEEWNLLNGKSFKAIPFRTDTGMSKILPKKEFIETMKQKKTNGPSNDVERIGAMYDPYEDLVYLRDDGISSGAYHDFLHQGQYGMRNPYVTQWRIGQLIDPKRIESLNPKQKAYYLSEQELPVYLRQNGENMNINVGDPYPGDEAFDKMLFDNPIFGSAHYIKRDTPEEKRLFWRALNGTLFGLTGLGLIHQKQE